jgi:hypothetical protein
MSPYSIYVRTYGKVASGAKITELDFLRPSRLRFFRRAYGPEAETAAAMAVQDSTKDTPMRSKAEVEAELRRLLA